MMLLLPALLGFAAPKSFLEINNWSRGAQEGWLLPQRQGSQAIPPNGQLHLEDDGDSPPEGVEAAYPHPLQVSERFAILFRARFLKLGLADESTGYDSLLRLLVGVTGPAGDFGINFSFMADRYNVENLTKVVRTDTRWHDWRLEVDTRRKTVAMLRDGEYVCLHAAGSPQAPGVRLRVKGSRQIPAIVEIEKFALVPLPPEAKPQQAAEPRFFTVSEPGEWPMWRRDVRNTGVSPIRGGIRSPHIAWSYPTGGQAVSPVFLDLDGDGKAEALISHGGNLTAHRLDGTLLWKQRLDNAVIYGLFDLDDDGVKELVVAAGVPSQAHILRAQDRQVRHTSPMFPKSGVAAIRIARMDPSKKGLQAIVWSHFHEIGYCLSFEQGVENGKVDWTFDWKKTFFTPTTAIADMDKDGVLDLVVATYNNAFVFDGRTGAQKMALEWNSGRCYGHLVVKDVDGDGYPDVVVLADVLREHVGVIKNEGGQSLKLLWDKFYEQNYPEDHVSLRVLTESVDDFDGDGKIEIAYAAYDDRVDSLWHTLMVDALTGTVKQDISGCYLVGAGRLAQERPPIILLSKPSGRERLNLNRLEAWLAKAGQWQKEMPLPDGTLLSNRSVRDFALNTWGQVSGIATGTPSTALTRLNAASPQTGFFLLRKGGRRVEFWTENGSGRLHPSWQCRLPAGLPEGTVEDVASVLPDRDGPQILYAGADRTYRVIDPVGKTIAQFDSQGGALAIPLVARLKAGDPPSVLFIDGQGVLHCMRARTGKPSPEKLWSKPATGCWSYYIPNSRPYGVPVVADIDGDGTKEILVAQKPNRLCALGPDGEIKRTWRFPALPMQWTVGNFDGDSVPDLLVTYPAGAILDVMTAAVSGKTGRTLWRVHCGNGPAAVCDLDGDGLDDAPMRDLYERRTLSGRTGRDIQPIVMQAGYHTPVITGESADGRYPGVFWVGGTWSVMAEDPGGEPRWLHWISPTGTGCVADIDGDRRLEVGTVTAGEIYHLPDLHPVEGPDKEFLCYDARTGELKWSYPIGTTSPGVVAADLDGDGQSEFLFGTADGRLIALKGDPGAGPKVLWEMTFPAALGVPVVCDADGDGRMDIVVSCADGRLYGVTRD